MYSENAQRPDLHDDEVDINNPVAIEHWTEFWNISEVELRKAIAEVGTNAVDLSINLGKAAYGGGNLHQAGLESGSGHTATA